MPAKRNTTSSSRPSQSGVGMGGGHRNGKRTSSVSAGGLRPSQSGNPTGFRPSQSGNSAGSRPSQSGSPTGGARPSQSEGLSPEWARANASGHHRQSQMSSKKGQGPHRLGSAAPLTTPPSPTTGGPSTSVGMPVGSVLGALATGGASTAPSVGEVMVSSAQQAAGTAVGAPGKDVLLPEQLLPKVNLDCTQQGGGFVSIASGTHGVGTWWPARCVRWFAVLLSFCGR